MARNNLFNLEDYRRPKVRKEKPRTFTRRAPVINHTWLTLDEFKKAPDLRITAQMEMIREYIEKVEKQRPTHPRVSRVGIDLCRGINKAQRKSVLQLRRDLMESTEKDWFAYPNRYLAIIEELTPPTTKS